MKGDEERIRAAGCDGYIAKPMRYQEFLATIAAQLAQRMTADLDIADRPAARPDRRRRAPQPRAAGGHAGAGRLRAARPPPAAKRRSPWSRAQPPDLDPARHHDAGHGRLRGGARRSRRNPATKNIPIIMVTALDDRDARMLGLSAGAEDFLTKPVDRAELCVRVRNLLRLKAYGDYHDKYSQMLEGEVGSRTADLVESERLYRSTFDAAPVGIVHVGPRRAMAAGQPAALRSARLLARRAAECAVGDAAAGSGGRGRRGRRQFAQMAAGTLDRHVVDEKRYRRRDGSVDVGAGQHLGPPRRRGHGRSTSSRSSRTSPSGGRSRRRCARRTRWTRSASWRPASPTTSTTC